MIDINEHVKRRKLLESSILKIKDLTPSHLLNLSSFNVSFGVHSIVNNNIAMAKQFFHNVSLIDSFNIYKYQSQFLAYDIPKVSSCLLSDNWLYLEKVYSKLRYNTRTNLENISMDEMVFNGASTIWCNTIQMFMAKNLEIIERNLNIIETVTLPHLPVDQKDLRIDYEYYKALLSKDKNKCEELLDQLVSPKIHEKRNDQNVLAKYISQPAAGYAKLAWKYGIEVEINSKLIPYEILPIAPLDKYDSPYDFLTELTSLHNS